MGFATSQSDDCNQGREVPDQPRVRSPASKSNTEAASSMTIEAWAFNYVTTTELETKRHPTELPVVLAEEHFSVPSAPGRPVQLQVTRERPKNRKAGALVRADARAELNHKFWHHELQAAELFCWAILRFPEAEEEFRRGLLRLVSDEIRHMSLYEERILADGYHLGSFPVRDWFWDRLPTCNSPLQFVALMGMGLEAANLEHTQRFAQWFRKAGDEASARVQDQVGLEEVAHVRFANHWFCTWSGGINFEAWKSSLPPPLSPLLMRGKTIARERRLKAQFPPEFIDALSAWQPEDD